MSALLEDTLYLDGLYTENNIKVANFYSMLGRILITDLSLRLITVQGTKRTNSYSWAVSRTTLLRHCDVRHEVMTLLTNSRLSERSDVTEKLMLAFEELMGVIKIGPAPPSRHGTENLMESGSAHSEASDSDGEICCT